MYVYTYDILYIYLNIYIYICVCGCVFIALFHSCHVHMVHLTSYPHVSLRLPAASPVDSSSREQAAAAEFAREENGCRPPPHPHGIHWHIHKHTAYICTYTYCIRMYIPRICMYVNRMYTYGYTHTCITLYISIYTKGPSPSRGGPTDTGPYVYIIYIIDIYIYTVLYTVIDM